MKKILVNRNESVYEGVILKLVTDLKVSEDKTWAKARAAQPNGVIKDVIVSGKKDTDGGKYLPLSADTLSTLKKGVAIRVAHAYKSINPTEKDGKKYLNETLRFSEWEPYQLPVYKFTGKVVGEIKTSQMPDGTPVSEFRMAQYRGKNADGSYKDSMFETVRFYGELPTIVKTGASLAVEGAYMASPRDVDGKHYDNEYIAVRKVSENKPYFLIIDEDTNTVIGTEPYESKEQAEAPAPTEQTYEPQPAPAAPNGEAGEEDCPF